MQASSFAWTAASKALVNSSMAWTVEARAMPAARARASRSLPVAGAVGKPGSGLLPHELASEQQGHRMQAGVGQGLSLGNATGDVFGIVKEGVGDAESAQHGLGGAAALRLPGIALAEVAAVTDDHQQRN